MLESQLKPLTYQQANALEAIISFIKKNGVSPTIKEVGQLLGLTLNPAFHLVNQLAVKQYIILDDVGCRSIRVLHTPDGGNYIAGHGNVLPAIVGAVSSEGQVITAFNPNFDEFLDSTEVSSIVKQQLFAIRVDASIPGLDAVAQGDYLFFQTSDHSTPMKPGDYFLIRLSNLQMRLVTLERLPGNYNPGFWRFVDVFNPSCVYSAKHQKEEFLLMGKLKNQLRLFK